MKRKKHQGEMSRRQFAAVWPMLLAGCWLGGARMAAQLVKQDDSRLIQAFVDNLPPEGGIIVLPSGKYNFFRNVVVRNRT